MSFCSSDNDKLTNEFYDHEESCNFNKIFAMLINESSTKDTIKDKLDVSKEAVSGSSSSVLKSSDADKSSSAILKSQRNVTKVSDQPSKLGIPVNNAPASRTDMHQIFLHGKYLKKPLESIRDAMFSKEIHDGLDKLHFRTIYRTQTHSWPNILDGRSIFIVNGQHSGKTFSYLPAILTLIASEEAVLSPSARGPTGVIIVRSSREVEELYRYCLKLVPPEKIKVIKAFGLWNCNKKRIDIINGCDLLITTPPCFARLAEGEVVRLFDKKCIKHCVFDGIDTMTKLFDKEIKLIIKTCTSGDKYPDLNPQLIMTSSSWIEDFRHFMKLVSDPVVIIGSFVEAALYSKCHFVVSKKTQDEKLEELSFILDENVSRTKKMLIVTNSETELNILVNFLNENHYDFEVFDTSTTADDFKARNKIWEDEEPRSLKLFITCDVALTTCKFKSAVELIHFSLPHSWSKFSLRFATLSKHSLSFCERKTSDRCTTRIMLDEDNSVEIPRLIEFLQMRQLIKKVPGEINELVRRIIHEREIRKYDPSFDAIAPLCSRTLQFGACEKIAQCKKRHVFSEIDKPINIPCDGFIKFDLVAIRNPSQFAIKIREFRPLYEKQWIQCEKKLKRTEAMLENLQDLMSNSAIEVSVSTGDTLAVRSATERDSIVKWCRCKVLEKDNKKPPKAIVLLIDYGMKIIVQLTDLYVLPKELKLLDPLISELRIGNLVPYDNDENWDRETALELEKEILKEKSSDAFMFAEVSFSVQNIIFVETFEIRSRIEGFPSDCIKLSLKQFMIKKHFCLKDENIIKKLKEHMTRANLYVSEGLLPIAAPQMKTIPKGEKAEPRWKHLTITSDYQVHLLDFISPNKFYVRLDCKGNKILKSLMAPVESSQQRNLLKEVTEGDFCMIVEEQKTRRGHVMSIDAEQKSVKVFLLDAGKTIECSIQEIFELPVSLINIAPFQAVQCRWVGVKPRYNLKEWEGRLNKAICDFVTKACRSKLMRIRVISKANNIHDVVLFHPETGKRLDKIAIKNKYAEVDESFIEAISDPPSEEETDLLASKLSKPEQAALKKLSELLNSEDSDCTLTFSQYTQLPETARIILGEDQKSRKDVLRERKTSNWPKKTVQPEKITQQLVPSSLSYIHKHPKIEWRQNEFAVFLHVSAVDCIDYGLEINDSSMKILVKYDNLRDEFTDIVLYGLIDVKIISHEKIGLDIIVRLVKCIPMKWPRLTNKDESNRFISYNEEAIEYRVEVPDDLEQQIGRPAGYSDIDEDELRELSDEDDAEPF